MAFNQGNAVPGQISCHCVEARVPYTAKRIRNYYSYLPKIRLKKQVGYVPE